MGVVIDDVDEALLARMRTGVTFDSIESSIIPAVETISISKGRNERVTGHERREQVYPGGALANGNAEVVFTELLKATIAEQERSAGSLSDCTVLCCTSNQSNKHLTWLLFVFPRFFTLCR
jgi:hypothetical protein